MKRVAQCGALASMMLSVSTAASAAMIDSFQFSGGLLVTAGAGATPATITFPGDFSILTQNGGVAGDLVALSGSIDGEYDFDDPIGSTTVALTSPTAPNTFTIDDGIDVFTADIDLIELQGGGGGAIIGAIDFSSSSYAGGNVGLIMLNDIIQNTPDLTVTFQTLGGFGVNLDDLFQNGSSGIAAYSAAVATNLTAVPEPGPLALLGFGVLCSAAFASRRRSNCSNLAT